MGIVQRVLDTVARSEQFPAEAQIRARLAQPSPTHAYVQITSTTKTSDRYPGKFRLYDATAKTWADTDGNDPFGGLCWVVTPNGEALVTGREYEGRLWDFVGPAAATTYPVFIVSMGGGVTKDINYYRQVGTSPFTLNYSGGSITGSGWTAMTGVANQIHALPLVAPRSATIDAIKIWLDFVGGTDARLRLAIYAAASDTNLYPSSLLVESSELNAESGTGTYLSSSISASLEAGRLYWLCVLAKTVSAGSMPQLGAISSVFCHNILGISNSAWTGYFGLKATQTYGAYPATFPTADPSYLATGNFEAAVVHFSA